LEKELKVAESSETVDSMTKKYAGKTVKFRKVKGYTGLEKTEILSNFVYNGEISHAISVSYFAVMYKNKFCLVNLDDIKFI
jgi:hypothetical protein